MQDGMVLFFIGLVSILVGFGAGILIGRGGASGSGQAPAPVGKKELVRLWRDLRTGQLHIEVEGHLFRSAEEINTARRQFLVQVMESLRSWLGSEPLEKDVSLKAAPVVEANPLSESLSVLPPAEKPVGPSSRRPVSSPLNTQPGKETKRTTSLNPFDVFAEALRTPAPKTQAASASIVAQIDEILQEKLLNSPLSARGIRLMELPGKGMVVVIGLDHYEGIDAVPDPQISELLRQCVAEWEKRS